MTAWLVPDYEGSNVWDDGSTIRVRHFRGGRETVHDFDEPCAVCEAERRHGAESADARDARDALWGGPK